MEIKARKATLLKGLARAQSVADRKSSMPILSNVLLTVEGADKLRIAATDLYLGTTSELSVDEAKKGSVATNARRLFDIVKNLPEGEVILETEGQGISVRSGKIRYKLSAMPGDDFPPIPTPGEAPFFELPVEALGTVITCTQYSMSTDETRPHLSGALLEYDGTVLRMVTTDGHRLSKAEVKIAKPKGSLQSFSLFIPSRGIQELKRLSDEIKQERSKGENANEETLALSTAGGNVFFRKEGLQLSVKLAEEQFPPYSKVVPQSHSKSLTIHREAFLDALKRMSLIASDRSGVVRLEISSGLLRIASENPEVGEGNEELEVRYEGDPINIGFNGKYIQDALACLLDDEVLLELQGELDPGVIKPRSGEGFLGVVMPMRI